MSRRAHRLGLGVQETRSRPREDTRSEQREARRRPYLLMRRALQQLLFHLDFLLRYLSHFKIDLEEENRRVRKAPASRPWCPPPT